MGPACPDKPSQAWSTLRLLNWTAEYLAGRGVDCPRLAGEIILAHCLGCRRIELYSRFDAVPSAEQLAACRRLVRRAGGGEPVAYLVGQKEFYSLSFKVTPAVMVPRPESELLVTAAVEHLRGLGRAAAVWDVCTGSGCLAVAVARHAPDAQVLATDISPEALSLAAENAAAHDVAGRVHCLIADLLTLPSQAPDCFAKGCFDVITANPPYVAAGEPVARGVHHEPKVALYAGADGLDFLRRIVADAPAMLAPGGILAVEFGYRHADAVRDLMAAGGRLTEPKILRDHNGIERAAVAGRKK